MKLSIITINYNNIEGLKKTSESVISQTWHDFEWIIIDGGSTDGSKEYIERLAATPTNNISYWCSEPDKGIYNAMNKGIAHANGEYLNFMNSGDFFCNSHVLQNVFSDEHNADILYGDWYQEDDSVRTKLSVPQPYTILDIYNRYNICHQAMFIKRHTHKRYLYDESYKLYADMKNWMLMALNGCAFEYLPISVCVFQMGGICCTDKEKQIEENNRIDREVWPPIIVASLNDLNNYKKHEALLGKMISLINAGGIRIRIIRPLIKLLSRL